MLLVINTWKKFQHKTKQEAMDHLLIITLS